MTAAILALGGGGGKPKVAFVRAGGPPLTIAMPFGPGGEAPMSDAAERLQLYNFDVVEKDLTGSFARQSQGMFPEASDEDLKSALWIVWDYGRPQPNPETGEGGSIAPQVAQHLQEGGSAIVLAAARSDPMTEALSPWGVDLRADAVVVHEKIPSAGSNSRDIVETVLRYPYVFDLHNYGDHPLAKPLDSLEGLFATMAPVSWRKTKGCHAEPLLPVPTAPQRRRRGARPTSRRSRAARRPSSTQRPTSPARSTRAWRWRRITAGGWSFWRPGRSRPTSGWS